MCSMSGRDRGGGRGEEGTGGKGEEEATVQPENCR